MSRALYTAATGMIAQQMNVDNIANNLANVNTTGYKKTKIEFQDLLYQQLRLAGATQAEGAQVPVELQIGYGTRAVATQRIFTQGTVISTNNPLDVSINGDAIAFWDQRCTVHYAVPDYNEQRTMYRLSIDGDKPR